MNRFTSNCLVQLCQLSRNINVSKGFTSVFITDNNNSTTGRKSVISKASMSYSIRLYSTKLIQQEVLVGGDRAGEVEIDMNLINHLERTSLVDFGNDEALVRLQEAIQFADTLFQVDTNGIEPLISVLEHESLFLREDKVEVTNREDIMKNAIVTEEDYFVAPPGNIPLQPQSDKTFKSTDSKNK